LELYHETHIFLIAAFLITGKISPLKIGGNVEKERHNKFFNNSNNLKTVSSLSKAWEDNIKMDLQEVEGGCGDWMVMAQDRDMWRALVNMLMNLRVPKMLGIS